MNPSEVLRRAKIKFEKWWNELPWEVRTGRSDVEFGYLTGFQQALAEAEEK